MYGYFVISIFLALILNPTVTFSASQSQIETIPSTENIVPDKEISEDWLQLTRKINEIKGSYLKVFDKIPDSYYTLPEQKEALEDKIFSFQENRQSYLGEKGLIYNCKKILIQVDAFKIKMANMGLGNKVIEIHLHNTELMCTKFIEKAQTHIAKLNSAIQAGKTKYAGLHGNLTDALASIPDEQLPQEAPPTKANPGETNKTQVALADAQVAGLNVKSHPMGNNANPSPDEMADSDRTLAGDSKKNIEISKTSPGPENSERTQVATGGFTVDNSGSAPQEDTPAGTSEGSLKVDGGIGNRTAQPSLPNTNDAILISFGMPIRLFQSYKDYFDTRIGFFKKSLLAVSEGEIQEDGTESFEQDVDWLAQNFHVQTINYSDDYIHNYPTTLLTTNKFRQSNGFRVSRLLGSTTSVAGGQIDFSGKIPGRVLIPNTKGGQPGSSQFNSSDRVSSQFKIQLVLANKFCYECQQGGLITTLDELHEKFSDSKRFSKMTRLSESAPKAKRIVNLLYPHKEKFKYNPNVKSFQLCDVLAVSPAFAFLPGPEIEAVEAEIAMNDVHPLRADNPKIALSFQEVRKFSPYLSQVDRYEKTKYYPENISIETSCQLENNPTLSGCNLNEPKNLFLVGSQVYTLLIDLGQYLFDIRDRLLVPRTEKREVVQK